MFGFMKAANMHAAHLLATRATPSQQGAAKSPPNSQPLSGLLATLIPLLIINGIFLALFLIFRRKFLRIYEPRTYVGRFSEFQKTPKPSNSMFGWIKDFRSLPDDYILNHQSLDGYLFLRYFKILIVLTFIGAVITWPILFPVNATSPDLGNIQFDLLSFANAAKDPNRYYATVLLAYIYFAFVMFVIGRETLFYIHLRQKWLLTPNFASRMSSRTVLFTDVPEQFRDEARLRSIFPFVKHVWLATDTKELQALVKDRDKTAMKLEGAEIGLSKAGNQQRMKLEKKNQAFENPLQWVDEKKRPTHKLKFLIGPKVDTINWCREHLQEVIPQTETLQAAHWNGETKRISAAFIEFENVQAAEAAYQQLTYHKPKTMQPRAIGMRPQEVIWSNLDKPWLRRDGLYAAATAIVVLMILFWTPFTVFCGLLTNIPKLAQISFLTWINKIPKPVLGVVTGLLPSILLAILMALVPIFLRLLAKFIGGVTVGEIEMQTQNWYMAFQVVQVFLITTFSSGAASVGKQIADHPSQATTLLAGNLPTASNFYISYFVVFGIGTTAGLLLNIVGLAIFVILKNLLMNTPRKRFNQYISIAGLGWGAIYPKFSCLGIIALTYSMIAPLVLGFAAVGFGLLYIAFRYNLIYVLDTANISMQGSSYPRALQHLTVGIYLNQVCIIGLLATAVGESATALGPMILMIVLLIATILAHISMRNSLSPLLKKLPRDLLAETTRNMGTSTQMESGLMNQSALGQDGTTLEYNGNGKESSAVQLQPTLSEAPVEHQSGWKGRVQRFLHPAWVPKLADHLAIPVPDYSDDVRREAYLDASITSPTPLLWLVHDDLGISTREKEESGKVIGTTDQGAFWDQKGKLQTAWENQPYEKEDGLVRSAPIYEDPIIY